MLVTHMLTNQDSMEINFSNFRAKLRSLKPDLCKHKKKTFQKPFIIHQSLLAVLGDEDGYCMLMS